MSVYGFAAAFRLAHRLFCAAEIFALAIADIVRLLRTTSCSCSPGHGTDGLTALPNSSDEIAALMPYELAAKLKQRSDTQAALRIAVSGLKQRERAGDALDAFDYYLNKPVDVPELLALLDHERPTVAQDVGSVRA